MQKYDVENSSVDHLNWTYKNIAIMNIFIQEEKEKKRKNKRHKRGSSGEKVQYKIV